MWDKLKTTVKLWGDLWQHEFISKNFSRQMALMRSGFVMGRLDFSLAKT